MWTVWGNSRASRSAAAKIPSSTIFSRPSTVCPLVEAEVHVVFIFGCFDLIKRIFTEKGDKISISPPFIAQIKDNRVKLEKMQVYE